MVIIHTIVPFKSIQIFYNTNLNCYKILIKFIPKYTINWYHKR